MLDLFTPGTSPGPSQTTVALVQSAESPEQRATRRIQAVLRAGHPVVLAMSGGKDSAALVNLALNSARAMVDEGDIVPPIVIVHSDTLVELPDLRRLVDTDLKKVQAYGDRHGLQVLTRVARPTLSDSFPVRVIGGRALPSFPDTHADCSTQWKRLPNERVTRKAFEELNSQGLWKPPVLMTGVRAAESNARDARIAHRGEVAEGIWVNDLGALRASPILDFDVDSVWEYLGLCAAGVIPAYSDFAETMRIYRDAGGSSCVIVADMKLQGQSKPCSARTGCWICTKVKTDHSATQMMASNPERNGWLKPLNDLRNFISHTQYDWTRRHYVMRTIDKDGFITIGPDTYSPAMLQELLRYALSAQVVTGHQIISIRQLVAIDARWSIYAMCPPFTALKIFREVEAGQITLAPDVPRSPKTPVPRIGKIYVGESWAEAIGRDTLAGLRDIGAEMFHETCGPGLRQIKDGSLVIDMEGGLEFDVDEQGAHDFLEFIADDKIRNYCRPDCVDWTWGYKTYLQYGTLNVPKGRSSMTHEILQRSQWRQANSLHGQQDPAELAKRCTLLHEAAKSAPTPINETQQPLFSQ